MEWKCCKLIPNGKGLFTMKKRILVLILLMIISVACSTPPTGEAPETVVKNFIEAVFNEDGEAVAGYLSSDLIAEFCVDGNFEAIKANPEMSAENLESIDIHVTAEETEAMSEAGFVALVFSSSVMSTQMAPLETVEIGEAAITGSTATVPVTTEGSTELFQLVLAGDSWKLNSFL